MLRVLACICALVLFFEEGMAQKPDYKAKTFIGADDSIFWNRSLPVYLNIGSSSESPEVQLGIQNPKTSPNPIYFYKEGLNYIKTRLRVEGNSREVLFPVFVDGLPPKSTANFLDATIHVRSGKKYVGQGGTIQLNSKDENSGVDQIYYAVDDENYKAYTDRISFEKSGPLLLRYYAVDRVGNDEVVKQDEFIMDYLPPKTHHVLDGSSVNGAYSLNTKLSFASFDSLAGVQAIYYKLDDDNFVQYHNSLVKIEHLKDGDHVLRYYAIDHVENKEPIQKVEFFLDRTPPLLATDILGDRFIVGDEVYFSGRTKLKFTAVDNKVGVKEVKYSINNEPFKTYDQPFYLPSTSGRHSIQYFAVDKLLNKTRDKKTATGVHEYRHKATKVYVDLTGPNLGFDITGKSLNTRDTLFVNTETRIHLKAYDRESGLQKITYSLEGSPEEFDYQKPLSLVEEGYHAIDYYAYDNVNNRNLSHLNVYLDNKGPEIYYFFSSEPFAISKEGLSIYSNEVSVYLAATDDHVNLKTITYQIDDGVEIEYSEKIILPEKNRKYKLKIKVIDVLGNTSTKQVEFLCGR